MASPPHAEGASVHGWTTEDGVEFHVHDDGHIYERGDVPEDDVWEAGPDIGREILRFRDLAARQHALLQKWEAISRAEDLSGGALPDREARAEAAAFDALTRLADIQDELDALLAEGRTVGLQAREGE